MHDCIMQQDGIGCCIRGCGAQHAEYTAVQHCMAPLSHLLIPQAAVLAAQAVPVVGELEAFSIFDRPAQLDRGPLSPLHAAQHRAAASGTTAIHRSLAPCTRACKRRTEAQLNDVVVSCWKMVKTQQGSRTSSKSLLPFLNFNSFAWSPTALSTYLRVMLKSA